MERPQALSVSPGPLLRAGASPGRTPFHRITVGCGVCLVVLSVAGCASDSSTAPPTEKEKREGSEMRQQMRMQRGKPVAGPNAKP